MAGLRAGSPPYVRGAASHLFVDQFGTAHELDPRHRSLIKPGWQRVFRVASEASKWDLHDEAVENYMGAAFQYVMELLAGVPATALRLDPSGESSLGLAKRMRIAVMTRVTSPTIAELTSTTR